VYGSVDPTSKKLKKEEEKKNNNASTHAECGS
jgi:hypothetical protein